jgi:hypothetical protein
MIFVSFFYIKSSLIPAPKKFEKPVAARAFAGFRSELAEWCESRVQGTYTSLDKWMIQVAEI